MNMNCSINIQDIPSSWKTGKIQYDYLEKHYDIPCVTYEVLYRPIDYRKRNKIMAR